MSSTALTLRDLVDRAMTRQQVTSGRALADRAKVLGYPLAHTTVNAIRAGTYKAKPGGDTVVALARLAGVSDQVAFEAAGLPIPGPRLADQLPPEADLLSTRERSLVVEMIRVLLDARKEVASDGKPQPRREATQQAGSAPIAVPVETGGRPEVFDEEFVRSQGWAAHVVDPRDVQTSEDEVNSDIPPSS